MIQSYFNTIIVLFCSWAVYGYCQRDATLPILAGVIVLGSLVLRIHSTAKYEFFEKIPAPFAALLSLGIGFLWRGFIPVPEDANSPFPGLISAVQSACIIAATLMALRPLTRVNLYRLIFCAWLIVPLSMNIPFSPKVRFIFPLFSLIALSLVIIDTMRRPTNKRNNFRYAQDYVIFSILLIGLTTILFLTIAFTMVTAETAFLNTMNDFMWRRPYTHFLNIRPILDLSSPGASASDRRPVLEVTMPGSQQVYLKMQVFDQYRNGRWNEVKNSQTKTLPIELPANQPVGQIVMFTSFKNLIPVPRGVTAIESQVPYTQSEDQIVYANRQQEARVVNFAFSPSENAAVNFSKEDLERYTALPSSLAPQLREIAESITLGQGDARAKAHTLTAYFRENFQYSLNVNFPANDLGLLKMLREKRPAYCTHFASALALLLRSEGIPARVAAGFMTFEKMNSHNRFLARVNNAHAWTEVLLPFVDSKSGTTVLAWRGFDATPSLEGVLLKKTPAYYLELMFEKVWLTVMRLKAKLENADQKQVKLFGILILIGLILLINRRQIIASLRQWIRNKKTAKKPTYKTPNALGSIYRRYEDLLKEKYGQVRQPSDTDKDVVERIRKELPEDAVIVEAFVKEFQAARFGGKEGRDVEDSLEKLIRLKSSKANEN